MNIFIIYGSYNFEDKNLHLGGITTYLLNLFNIFVEIKAKVHLLQFGKYQQNKKLNDFIEIHSIKTKSIKNLINYAEKKADLDSDIILFSTSTVICKNNFKKSIAIQHGIYWDISSIHGMKIKSDLFSIISRAVQSYTIVKQHKLVSKIVCVDYNYINWLRTQVIDRNLNCVPILNFANFENNYVREKNKTNRINIVFARRFTEIRGVALICKVMPKILKKYKNVSFTIAGRGEKENKLIENFKNMDRVTFTQYENSKSCEFHKNYDIALIPSIGSEGTSLSLLEAMSVGCACICSDVGGMSNIVLDGFNGIIIEPNEELLYKAICDLVENEEKRNNISKYAMETIRHSFSLDKWKKSWIDLINNI